MSISDFQNEEATIPPEFVRSGVEREESAPTGRRIPTEQRVNGLDEDPRYDPETNLYRDPPPRKTPSYPPTKGSKFQYDAYGNPIKISVKDLNKLKNESEPLDRSHASPPNKGEEQGRAPPYNQPTGNDPYAESYPPYPDATQTHTDPDFPENPYLTTSRPNPYNPRPQYHPQNNPDSRFNHTRRPTPYHPLNYPHPTHHPYNHTGQFPHSPHYHHGYPHHPYNHTGQFPHSPHFHHHHGYPHNPYNQTNPPHHPHRPSSPYNRTNPQPFHDPNLLNNQTNRPNPYDQHHYNPHHYNPYQPNSNDSQPGSPNPYPSYPYAQPSYPQGQFNQNNPTPTPPGGFDQPNYPYVPPSGYPHNHPVYPPTHPYPHVPNQNGSQPNSPNQHPNPYNPYAQPSYPYGQPGQNNPIPTPPGRFDQQNYPHHPSNPYSGLPHNHPVYPHTHPYPNLPNQNGSQPNSPNPRPNSRFPHNYPFPVYTQTPHQPNNNGSGPNSPNQPPNHYPPHEYPYQPNPTQPSQIYPSNHYFNPAPHSNGTNKPGLNPQLNPAIPEYPNYYLVYPVYYRPNETTPKPGEPAFQTTTLRPNESVSEVEDMGKPPKNVHPDFQEYGKGFPQTNPVYLGTKNYPEYKGPGTKGLKGVDPEVTNPGVDLRSGFGDLRRLEKKKKTPQNGQLVRLRRGRNYLDGYLQLRSGDGEWGLACDRSSSWNIAEASVVCKELGFERGAELSWQGYPVTDSSEELQVATSHINCTGTEASFAQCRVRYTDKDSECDVSKNAVGLRCYGNLASHCQPGEVHYSNHCYKVLDENAQSLGQAADSCREAGGHLLDISTQFENDFLSEWLLKTHPETTAILTGGVGVSVMGNPMWLWEGTESPMIFQKWWTGWEGKKGIPQGRMQDPVCVVLRRSFPCSAPDSSEERDKEEEMCSADYFFWDAVDCKLLSQMQLPHVCERPIDDIGCVIGNGESYTGRANTTTSGAPCLPWDHPRVQQGLSSRTTPRGAPGLSGHNHCRNLGVPDRHPWCFVEGRSTSEYCEIPHCWSNVPGYSRSAVQKSSCKEGQFECEPGRCIPREKFCDGEKDCSNGRDETKCQVFLQEFSNINGKRMNGHEREKWPGSSENQCAKRCLEAKRFICRSFSYQPRQRSCILSDSNTALSGHAIPAPAWRLHERLSLTRPCNLDAGLFQCRSGQCVNASNVCDSRKHCEDGSDEADCSRMGYQVRLVGGKKNEGRLEIKLLGQWGQVCDDLFDLRAAHVACRELGFSLGAAEVLPHSRFPLDKPLFLLDDVQCLGNETSLRECVFPGWSQHDCGPQESVGLVCRVPGISCPDDQWQCQRSRECVSVSYLCDNIADCEDGSDEDLKRCNSPTQIRLVGGNATAGRLEIRHFDIWGTVCDDDFTEGAALLVCRLLGQEGTAEVRKNALFGPGQGQIWLDQVHCAGNETGLEHCFHSPWGQNNCKHDEDVSIICKPRPKQKSSWPRPIAVSDTATSTSTGTEEKLHQMLLSQCGTAPPNPTAAKPGKQIARVVAGSDVARGSLPWQASIRVRSGAGRSAHWCGAVVISSLHVLTAAHCMRDYNKAAYSVRVGDYDMEVVESGEKELAIDHLYVHPEFNKEVHLNNDLALLKLKSEIPLGHTQPVCLATSEEVYVPGTNCSVSGWGSVSPTSGFARTLRRAWVPLLEPSLCRANFVYGEGMSPGMICAGGLEGGADSCQGDSGGPLVCRTEEKDLLLGITSWGHGCGRANKPGVYTNVAHYRDWIQGKMKQSLSP